jgi:hypothetical protein
VIRFEVWRPPTRRAGGRATRESPTGVASMQIPGSPRIVLAGIAAHVRTIRLVGQSGLDTAVAIRRD